MHAWLGFSHRYHWNELQISIADVALPATVLAGVAILFLVYRSRRARSQVSPAARKPRQQIRPMLQVERLNKELCWRSPGQRIVLRNIGCGAAVNTAVELFRGSFERSLGTYFGFELFVISPDQTIHLAFPTYMAYSLRVVYLSVKGDRFTTSISFPDGDATIHFQQDVLATVSATPFLTGLVQGAGRAHLYGGPPL
jgi:hypothetical protein